MCEIMCILCNNLIILARKSLKKSGILNCCRSNKCNRDQNVIVVATGEIKLLIANKVRIPRKT